MSKSNAPSVLQGQSLDFLAVTGALAVAGSPAQADAISMRSRRSINKDPNDDPSRVPHPSHRHASPSAPWPWVDLEDVPPLCTHVNCGGCWRKYPQSRFPNWTYRQVVKSKIQKAITEYDMERPCVAIRSMWMTMASSRNPGSIIANHKEEDKTWERLVGEKRLGSCRVRALFIENMSGPILQMLGAKTFFLVLFLNWIPSRFKKEIQPGIGDHITITLTFLKSMSNHDAILLNAARNRSSDSLNNPTGSRPPTLLGSQRIDTHAPLALYSNDRLLVLDLLAVHLIRNINGSTIISYHPTMALPTTTAPFLHQRIRFAGQSVYWQSIFQQSHDPTFILLTFVWHALYAWDEALESLYQHICSLETRVISTAEMPLTKELHVVRAHHLHYTSLLDDFAKHVDFIRNTPNPAFDNAPPEDKELNRTLMERECNNLLSEIRRLTSELIMQEKRLKNVMGLVFSSVNITDSRYMREMTEAAVRDSAAMKQIAYLTMVFLPASFVAAVFGMNVAEINPGSLQTIPHYVEIALPLTLLTAWIIIAFQSRYLFPESHGKRTGFLGRLGWPGYLVWGWVKAKRRRGRKDGASGKKGSGIGSGFGDDDKGDDEDSYSRFGFDLDMPSPAPDREKKMFESWAQER